ncbi:putative membrane protein [Nymphon striatum]|nr:putative membrane protein [Nymphon striatum]
MFVFLACLISGTKNSQNIIGEIGIFIMAALGVTSLLFFFFFRSLRATLISMGVVIVGVMWAFGILGLLQYEITVLTALIPPLIIVIGIPNCIFLINKYQQEIKKHGNQALSLQRVIAKIGNATLMTNVTTASGFATFIVTDSKLLKEFGIVASINIIGIFILSLLIIPIIYSFLHPPKTKHLKHLNKKWIDGFVNWTVRVVREQRIAIYATSIVLLVMSIIGIYQIDISGSIIEDMPKKEQFFKDIRFFEKEFDGIMPVEIVIDTKTPKGVLKPATLKRIDRLGDVIEEIPELSKPVSVLSPLGLIALFMAYLFRSFRMIIISLIPNLLPLLITAGVMGFVGVPIKPSTILVFSIAFGISVDDTIHFLAKYRQELIANNWRIKVSVYAALKETGVSMFYTSIVLFFGFSVFIISNFGGTVALGALVSATLLFAMLANLVLLPSLLLSLEKSIANKETLKKPQIDILPKGEDKTGV